MKRFILEVPEPSDEILGCGFDLVDEDGRRANGLNFDEMLGQIVSMTHPRLDGKPQYRMQTAEDWAAERAAAEARMAARRDGKDEFADLPF